jgi:pimeloyl-ACP methyl ester carboxylesterase
LVHYEDYDATTQIIKQDQIKGAAADQVHFRLDDTWTLPAVVLTPAEYESTVILISDEGRASLAKQAQRHAAAGRRVVAADLTGFGEANGDLKQVEPLLIATVGRRPLGVYAAQLAALARWARGDQGNHPVTVTATGPRNGTIALVAAALETDAISALDLHDTWGSLTQLIEKNLTAEDAPEQFCFGLLKELDIPQLIALVAPRSVVVHEPDAELRSQRSTLRSWYATLGANLDPLTNESSSRTVQD